MSTQVSTGFATAILGTRSFDQIFRYGCIEVYTGPQPDTADMPATGALVARVSLGGNAWEPGAPTNGLGFLRSGRYAMKDAAEDWVLQGLATGEAGWFRLRGNAVEDAPYSTFAPRIDGTIGVDGTTGDIQMFLPTVAFTTETKIPITNWWYAMPPIGA